MRRWALWPALIVLAAIGVTAAVARGAAILSGGSTIAPIRELLPAMVVEDVDFFETWFAGYPVLMLVHVVFGVVFLALAPFGGTTAASAIGFFGSVFVVSMFRGLAAIRRGDQQRHREWMLRMVSVGAGVAGVRVIGLPLMAVTGLTPLAVLGASFWLSMGTALLAAELWIRWTRIRPAQLAAFP